MVFQQVSSKTIGRQFCADGFGDIKFWYYALYFKFDVHSFDSEG